MLKNGELRWNYLQFQIDYLKGYVIETKNYTNLEMKLEDLNEF